MSRLATALLFGPAALWLGVAGAQVAVTVTDASAWSPPDRTRSTAVGSQTCRSCHPREHHTWSRSFHRTMTQRAEGDAVLAPFAGETVHFAGFVARMDRAASGRPRMQIRRLHDGQPGELVLSAEVELTIGSHRYQQYVARIDDLELSVDGVLDESGGPLERWRLPVAWHVAQQRWIPMFGAFLVPDPTPGRPQDVLRFLSRWNDNCIFCHNTEPVPGLSAEGVFETEVAELGIACEACHGPASAHVQRHASPLRRLLAGAVPDGVDGSVAHPGRLGSARASEICGRCHGQRIGRDMQDVLAHGDGFLPGTELAAVSRPIFADSQLLGHGEAPADTEPFADRFWPDGTPRLSAYEYQGLLLSSCHQDGAGLGCGDCHTMHGHDPDMQLRADYDASGTCERCHDGASLSGADASGGHGGHGDAIDCTQCHMPRTTYGLLEGMISHRITSPDPGAWVGRNDRPDACTTCHTDRSRAWAAAAMADLGLAGTPAHREVAQERWASRVVLDLYGGDPIQRALAAHALGHPQSVGDRAARRAALVGALEDEYPVVRWFAARALRRLAPQDADVKLEALLAPYDYVADPAERIELTARLREHLGPGPFDDAPERMQALQDVRDDRAIEIGE